MDNKQKDEASRAPRKIAIEVLSDDTPRSEVKFLTLPSGISNSTKVLDFRPFTMKSDFNQALLGMPVKEDKGRVEGRVLLQSKELLKGGQTLRPLLPKPAVEVLETPERSAETTDVTPCTSKTSVTSSSGGGRGRRKYSKRTYYAYVTESESDGETGGGGGGGDGRRKKKKTKSAEVEEVVSGRRKRASMSQKLAQWGLLPSGKEGEEEEEEEEEEIEEGEMLSPGTGRMKIAHMGEEEEEEEGMEKEVKVEDDEEEDKPHVATMTAAATAAVDEEEDDDDDEPLIAAPLPKFINIPLSLQTTAASIHFATKAATVVAPITPTMPSLLATTTTTTPSLLSTSTKVPPTTTTCQPVPITLGVITTTTPGTTAGYSGGSGSSRVAEEAVAEKEITSVLELEELLSGIERSKAAQQLQQQQANQARQATMPSSSYLPKTPLAAPLHEVPRAPAVQAHTGTSTGTQGGALRTITPSGWLKKASNMLHRNPLKRTDTMNKSLMCKPIMLTKGTVFNPLRTHKSTQTEEEEVLEKKSMVVPVPIPFYLPAPTTPCLLPSMHAMPLPLPLPLLQPLPSSRSALNDVIKRMEQQLAEQQTSGLQEDLLEMAEMISSTKTEQDRQLEEYNASIIRGVNDSDYVYPASAASVATRGEHKKQKQYWLSREASLPEEGKTYVPAALPAFADNSRSEEAIDPNNHANNHANHQRFSKPLPLNDDRMKLKYSYAMQAWRYWTEVRNQENSRRMHALKGRVQFFFQADPLQATAEQLSGSLAYFVRDVKKLDGAKFAPDSVYFLCLGLQYYLRENGREDGIFSDSTYLKFTDALNEVLSSFEMKINSQNMLICRVTEEHLWEAGQLGCHSPYCLLSSLIFFNTKHFLLTSPDDHLKLTPSSFEVVVAERRQDSTAGAVVVVRKLVLKLPGGEEGAVLENLEEPLKCPVRMHQFYLSKCTDGSRSLYCLPEQQSKGDHAWFSMNPLSRGALTKVLNRCLVVREVQVANLQQMQVEG